jgi:hypothetical protein
VTDTQSQSPELSLAAERRDNISQPVVTTVTATAFEARFTRWHV